MVASGNSDIEMKSINPTIDWHLQPVIQQSSHPCRGLPREADFSKKEVSESEYLTKCLFLQDLFVLVNSSKRKNGKVNTR